MNIAPRDFVKTEPKFAETFCSQCGGKFGPGDHGYSHCLDHRKYARRAKLAQQTDQMGAEIARLRSALNAMLTQFGLDEDDWNKPTFEQARKALRGEGE